MIRIDVDALIEPADHHIERPFEIGEDTQFLAENHVGLDGIGLELRIARFVEVAVGEILPRRVAGARDRKSVVWGKRVSVRVDIGGRRLMNNNYIVSYRRTPETLAYNRQTGSIYQLD